jgi:hypothetical protein
MVHNTQDYWDMDFVHRPEFYITVYVSETLCFLVTQNSGRWTNFINPVILSKILV